MIGMLKAKQMFTLNHIKNLTDLNQVHNVLNKLWFNGISTIDSNTCY